MKKLVFVLSAVVWGAMHSSSGVASNYHVYQKFELACPTGTERCRCPSGAAAVWICRESTPPDWRPRSPVKHRPASRLSVSHPNL
jgi:hypothetical protein